MEQVDSGLANTLLEDIVIVGHDGTVGSHLATIGSYSMLLHSLLLSSEPGGQVLLLPDFSVKEIVNMLSVLHSGQVKLYSKSELSQLITLTRILKLRPIKLTCEVIGDNGELSGSVPGVVFGDQGVKKVFRKVVDDVLDSKVLARTINQDLELLDTRTEDVTEENSDSCTCHICQAKVLGRNTFLDHLRLHRDQGGSYTCLKCSHREDTGLLLHRHNIDKHSTVPTKSPSTYTCDRCQHVFKTFIKLKVHMNEEHDMRPLKCDHCAQRFNDKMGLKTHAEAKHGEEKKYACDICTVKFGTARFLSQHRSQVHELSEMDKKAACTTCGFVARGKRNLSKHIKVVHEMEGSHKCSVCPRVFKSKYNLTIHNRTHTDDSPFPCPHCGKRFRRRQHLTTHLDTCRSNSQLLSLENVEFILDDSESQTNSSQ